MGIRAALVISVALVTFLFVGLGITKQADGPESIAMALTARPLLWIDEDRILVGKDNVIYLYDVGEKTSKSLYKVLGDEITTKFEWSCFTEHNWALFVIAGYPIKRRLFALVWGQGVLDGQSGIYELIGSSPTSRWQKLVAENVDGKASATLVFSPSGCRLTYSFGKAVKLLDVCRADAIGQSRLH